MAPFWVSPWGLFTVPAVRGMRVEDRQAAQWVSGISGSDGFHGHVPIISLQFQISIATEPGWLARLAL